VQLRAQDFVKSQDSAGDPLSREAERVAVAAQSLRHVGRLRLGVRGESMLPTLWPGDVVEIESSPIDSAIPGEIVLAEREGRFYLHRFVAHTDQNAFLLRGDSMPARDPEFSNTAFLGRLVSGADHVQALTLWSRALGQLLCHCAPARSMALNLKARRKKDSERNSEKKATNPEILNPKPS
jgi:hypothetical protein